MNPFLHEISVNAIIKKGDRILLLKRNQNNIHYQDYWTLPGGKIEGGELIEEALQREIKEESGVSFSEPLIFVASNSFFKQDGQRILSIVFLVKYKSGDVKINNEFSEFAWVDKEDFDRYQIIPDVKEDLMKVV